MAFGMETHRSQFNSNINKLLQYLMESKLMEQRQTGYMDLEQAQNKNMRDRAWDTWMYTISRDPEISRMQSEIFIKQRSGNDTTADQKLLKEMISGKGKSALAAVQGNLTQEDMPNIMSLSDETVRALMSQYGATSRQTQDIEQVQKPNQLMRMGELGVAGENVRLREAEIGLERTKVGKTLPDVNKETIKFVTDVEQYLIGMGVQPSSMKKLIQDITSGKAVNPLSAENQGKALQWLGEIRLSLAEGNALTPQEKRFLTNVRNVYQVQGPTEEEIPITEGPKGTGLVSPKTGMAGTEEAAVNPAIEQKVNQNMLQLLVEGFKKRGFNDAQALYHAQNLMGQLK